MKKYYILKIDSYEGEESSLMVNANGSDAMYVVLVVEGKSAEIVDWVMSCRTMNRTLEYAVESEVEKILASDGVATLRATYRPTPKNTPVANLFGRFGFAEVSRTADATSYECQLPRAPLPHQFALTP